MKTYTITLLILASTKAVRGNYSKGKKQEVPSMSFELLSAKSAKTSKGAKSLKIGESSITHVTLFRSNIRKVESDINGSGKAGKSDRDNRRISGDGKESKASSIRSGQFLHVDSSEDLFESMSLELIVSSGKSYKSHTNAKSSKKATRSNKDEKASSSIETGTNAKSSKKVSSKANSKESSSKQMEASPSIEARTHTHVKSSMKAILKVSTSEKKVATLNDATHMSTNSFKKVSSKARSSDDEETRWRDEKEVRVEPTSKSRKEKSVKANLFIR